MHQVRVSAAGSQAETKAPPIPLESIALEPISLISGEVELPGSKSLSNRVLLLSALAEVKFKSRVRVVTSVKTFHLGSYVGRIPIPLYAQRLYTKELFSLI